MSDMGPSNKVCPNCGRKMTQQFVGLQHCKCGVSWNRNSGFFERTPGMVFTLERVADGKKIRRKSLIRYDSEKIK